MRAERVVLPAPAIGQDLRLGSCCEQLGVVELIPEAAVKGFRESFSHGDPGAMKAVLVVVLVSHQFCRASA